LRRGGGGGGRDAAAGGWLLVKPSRPNCWVRRSSSVVVAPLPLPLVVAAVVVAILASYSARGLFWVPVIGSVS